MRWLPLVLLVACKPADDTGDTDPNDTDTNDTDPIEEPWSWCPTADQVVTAGGDGTLHATGDLWCAMGSEGRELVHEPAAKAQLLVVAGDYALPTATTADAPYRLPVCTQLANGDHVASVGDGTIDAFGEPYGDVTSWRWGWDQPMTLDGAPWSLTMDLGRETAPTETAPVVAMGRDAMLPWGDNVVDVSLNEGVYPTYSSWRQFVPCDYANPPRVDTTHVEFEGGHADLVVNMGQSMASTEPAMFVRGSGTYDGVDFDVTSYWSLIYNPEHHHFVRHFAVLFDEPIGAACGLIVRDVDAFYSDSYGTPAIVEVADCDLHPLQTLAVTAQFTERVSTY